MEKSNISLEILSKWDNPRGYETPYDIFFIPADGYFAPISAKVHLFRKGDLWATVFESSGYRSKEMNAMVQLFYFGNCLRINSEFPSSGSNVLDIELCSSLQLDQLSLKGGRDYPGFVTSDHKYMRIRGLLVEIDRCHENFRKNEIFPYNHPEDPSLVDSVSILRMLSIHHPQLFSARMDEIRLRLDDDLPLLMTIDDWYHDPDTDFEVAPSEQESYQLMAKVLSEGNPELWKPTQAGNLHWSNWPDAGNL